jgi:prepilin-type N-terminal cleavage/methylation domain-containing protein
MRILSRVRGLTLVEMMISIAIFSVIALAITTFIIDSVKVNGTVQAETDAVVLSQQSLDDLRWRLEQSRRLLDADSGFLPMFDLSAAPVPAGEVRLPKVVANASLTPRAGGKDLPFDASAVGNALLFVEALPPWKEPSTGRLVDLYRFVLYYVSKGAGEATLGHMPFWLDVTRVESVPYADFQQVDSLGGELANKAIEGLVARGVNYAWDAGAPAGAAFSKLANGEIVTPPEPNHRIQPKTTVTAVPGLGAGERAAGMMTYSIAPNAGEIPIHTVVPRFANPADGFPNGFEVLIAGPSHGRKVMVRMVIAARAPGNRWFSRETLMLAAVWD